MDALLPSNFHLPHLPPQKNRSIIRGPNDWNALIKHHAKLGNDSVILSMYAHMESSRILPDNSALPLVLKACARLNDVEMGKRVHESLLVSGPVQDVRVATALIDFYCKCGFVDDARDVFVQMRERDVVSWNAMLNGYVGVGEFEEVISLFVGMAEEGFRPNSRTIVALLLACKEAMNLKLGQEIHAYCLRNELFHIDGPHVGTALIGFYMNFDAKMSASVFDMMSVKNVVSWNAMITGYFQAGDYFKALELFLLILRDGIKFDSVTLLVVIQACGKYGSLELARQIHQIAVKCEFTDDLYIVSALVSMYSELGELDFACDVFRSVHSCDIGLWNSMLSAFIEVGNFEEAKRMFLRMQLDGIKTNERTMVIMLSLCPDLAGGLKMGKSLHARVIKEGMGIDLSLGNALLVMYEELNCVQAVEKVFGQMRDVDVMSWNTLIAALAGSKLKRAAWEIFIRMQKSTFEPNLYTIVSVLASCDEETHLHMGRSIHGYVIKHGIEIDATVSTALTEMYMNCGDEAAAKDLFDCFSTRDIISWNSLIASFTRNNETHKALQLFQCMMSEIEPNSVTLINVLSSCIHLADLSLGRCLHAYITRRESCSGSDTSLLNSLLTMYARCGSLQSAENIFSSLLRKDIISWNALITGYGMHGRGYDALSAFSRLLETGFRPNNVTFVAILSACSHSGLIEEGLELFNSMSNNFNITPELIHYGCVVDLLSRGGYLNEALHFINSMPIEADASLWRAFLSACQVHSSIDVDLVEYAFEKLIEFEPMNEGNYVLLSNIYAAAGLWSEVRRVRTLLKDRRLRKPPGISWIVIMNEFHYFTASDRSHTESDVIYRTLSFLMCSIRGAGYVPDVLWATVDE